jgi:hypothetical protein
MKKTRSNSCSSPVFRSGSALMPQLAPLSKLRPCGNSDPATALPCDWTTSRHKMIVQIRIAGNRNIWRLDENSYRMRWYCPCSDNYFVRRRKRLHQRGCGGRNRWSLCRTPRVNRRCGRMHYWPSRGKGTCPAAKRAGATGSAPAAEIVLAALSRLESACLRSTRRAHCFFAVFLSWHR